MAITTDTAGLYVSLVRKIYIVREVMDFFPRYGGLCIPVLRKLFYLRALRLYDLMTPHAPLHVGDSRDPGPVDINMAVLAFNGIIPCVNLVAEIDGLHGGKVREKGVINAITYCKGNKKDNYRYDEFFRYHKGRLLIKTLRVCPRLCRIKPEKPCGHKKVR